MKKSERLELIKKMVLMHPIETQHDLLRLLAEHGLELTQATISRDMNEIGIVKIPSGSGSYIYGLSQDSGKKIVQGPRSIKSTILAVSDKTKGLEQHLYLKVVPGNSKLIKRYLLADFSKAIFSLIADDDSLLLIAKSPSEADMIRQEILLWMQGIT
ncbi:TPA: arginine repressor [Streptococcus pyogenes]|uniref:arginine repressor n=1 Tax=Streptococcus pyogenes TaxID=1314 RepID=UPI00109CA56E|nr:arginine repressor [Streptococcus pyogenes]VHC24236.1 arginine repressor [Streptococcus pyogenes]HEQ4590965.1 arginine repressor [Streptococcus pyogenes]HER9129022.1 arginine repressor [Streptococcus pyogenes]HES5549436.1 arginine repressor [Streptococcus pyogenes]